MKIYHLNSDVSIYYSILRAYYKIVKYLNNFPILITCWNNILIYWVKYTIKWIILPISFYFLKFGH